VIRYALTCAGGHTFESWFANSTAHDKQAKRGLIACPVCGSTKVEQAVMAPAIARRRKRATRETATPHDGGETAPLAMISDEERELRAKFKELHQHLTSNADYVGTRFPEEARRMHYGEVEQRSIYGKASLEDAKSLHEEGIEFYPLPHLPDERN